MRAALAVTLLLTLAGCGSSGPPAREAREPSPANPAPAGASLAEAPPAGSPSAGAPLAQAPAPSSGMEAAETFPGTFRGRWGLVPADCAPGRPDAKGLMTVSADRLTFYESRARVTAASPTPTDGVAVTLAFTGEGQGWTAHSVFELADDRRTLLRTDRDPPLKLRYTRCPAPGPA